MSFELITTFESWVTRFEWYSYAARHRAAVPHVLVDRSQCTDPFPDQFSPTATARPLLSGLCRPRSSYRVGDRIMYLTRVNRRVLSELGRSPPTESGALYFLVAALRIGVVHPTHRDAAMTFSPGRYAPNPNATPYPPNLAHAAYPGAALARGSCITHDMGADPVRPHTPDTSTTGMHRSHYEFYRKRGQRLPVAECRFERGGRILDPQLAPILSAEWWRGRKMNQRGLRIDELTYNSLLRALRKSTIA